MDLVLERIERRPRAHVLISRRRLRTESPPDRVSRQPRPACKLLDRHPRTKYARRNSAHNSTSTEPPPDQIAIDRARVRPTSGRFRQPPQGVTFQPAKGVSIQPAPTLCHATRERYRRLMSHKTSSVATSVASNTTASREFTRAVRATRTTGSPRRPAALSPRRSGPTAPGESGSDR
jgi:hypothetical protein